MDFESDLPILQRYENVHVRALPVRWRRRRQQRLASRSRSSSRPASTPRWARHALERLRREPQARRAQRAGALLPPARRQRRADEDADDLGRGRCGDAERGARARPGRPRADRRRREGRPVQHRRDRPARRWRRDAAEPLNNLLYANGLSVQHVVTDGNVQVMDGEFVRRRHRARPAARRRGGIDAVGAVARGGLVRRAAGLPAALAVLHEPRPRRRGGSDRGQREACADAAVSRDRPQERVQPVPRGHTAGSLRRDVPDRDGRLLRRTPARSRELHAETLAWVEKNLDVVTGPIYVEGVRAGDVVAVRIDAIDITTPGTLVLGRYTDPSPDDWWLDEDSSAAVPDRPTGSRPQRRGCACLSSPSSAASRPPRRMKSSAAGTRASSAGTKTADSCPPAPPSSSRRTSTWPWSTSATARRGWGRGDRGGARGREPGSRSPRRAGRDRASMTLASHRDRFALGDGRLGHLAGRRVPAGLPRADAVDRGGHGRVPASDRVCWGWSRTRRSAR